MAVLGGYSHRIRPAIERVSRDFEQPRRIEQLAWELEMGVSSLQHHFKHDLNGTYGVGWRWACTQCCFGTFG